MANPCEHQWERTHLACTVYGRTWGQGKEIVYCPRCCTFATRTTIYLEGAFYTTQAAADAANEDTDAQCQTDKAAWLREHHPDQVEVRRAGRDEGGDQTPRAARPVRRGGAHTEGGAFDDDISRNLGADRGR